MSWKPISEGDLWDDIYRAFDRMTPEQRKIWEAIKIQPEKWQQDPWGNLGGGFWAVAVFGNNVVWFNDIEDGYSQSTYNEYGTIDEYWCNQEELEWAVQRVVNLFRDGYGPPGRMGPPQAIT